MMTETLRWQTLTLPKATSMYQVRNWLELVTPCLRTIVPGLTRPGSWCTALLRPPSNC